MYNLFDHTLLFLTMALLNILKYPDPRLHTVAKPVADDEFDATLLKLIEDMTETMYEADGVGLAATQVNVHKRIFVLDVSETRDDLQVFINPVITPLEGICQSQEGCLSVPGIYETVERAQKIHVQAKDQYGKVFSLEAEGLLSRCLQHETDHLNGKVFIEKLSQLKLNRIITKIKKDNRKNL